MAPYCVAQDGPSPPPPPSAGIAGVCLCTLSFAESRVTQPGLELKLSV